MIVAYLVNEISGQLYYLYRTMTIGSFNCFIEVSESIPCVIRIVHVRHMNYVCLYYNGSDFLGHVEINGVPVINSDVDFQGFNRKLYHLDFFVLVVSNFECTFFPKNLLLKELCLIRSYCLWLEFYRICFSLNNRFQCAKTKLLICVTKIDSESVLS